MARDSLMVHAPLIDISRKQKITQHIYCKSLRKAYRTISIQCYSIGTNSDSSIIYRFGGRSKLNIGVGMLRVDLTKDTDSSWMNEDLRQIIKRSKVLPAGNYSLLVSIMSKQDTSIQYFKYVVDSLYDPLTSAGGALNNELLSQKMKGRSSMSSSKNVLSQASIARSTKKLARKLKAKGLNTVSRRIGDKEYLDVLYKDRFVRYYEISINKPLAAIELERKRVEQDASSLVSTELESFQSVFSKLKDKDEKPREITGEISLSTNAATGQEEGSQQDDNFYELNGSVELPFKYLPVTVEGYYTSQDRDRPVKASFLKLHYDTEKAKEELEKLVINYKQKHEHAQAKGGQLEGVYASYLAKLQARRQVLRSELKISGLDGFDKMPDTSLLRQKITDQVSEKAAQQTDSNKMESGLEDKRKALAAKQDSINKVYAKAVERYRELEEVEKKIGKYQQLIEQYKRSNYFDSLMGYSKVKDIETAGDMSYKEMAKRSEHLLPDGKARSFINGITNIDAGIFSKEVSSYTLAGQNMKGVDLGYDFGLFQSNITVGNVEYVNRDGAMDRYTAYSGRVSFAPVQDHKATVIYYAYSPSGKMIANDEFFKNIDVAMPGFRSPVHIISVNYEGTLKQGISFQSEVATSFRKNDPGEQRSRFSSDKLAYKLNAEGDIPKTNLTLTGGYEHCGTRFENNSLPIAAAGTDLIKAGVRSTFFNNFLAAGVDYNHMSQQSLSYKGGDTKWGFEIKTQSKRYPSVSVSYKPFSTFRSATDTIAFSQRLLRGEVWTGKVSYQIKRKEYNIRWTAVYNRNSSNMDTIDQRSSVVQISCHYLRGPLNLATILGSNKIDGTAENNYSNVKTLSITGSYALTPQLTILGGQEMATGNRGLNRYSAIAGSNYALKKMPIAIGSNLRYSRYVMPLDQRWQNIFNINVTVTWRFNFPWKTTSL